MPALLPESFIFRASIILSSHTMPNFIRIVFLLAGINSLSNLVIAQVVEPYDILINEIMADFNPSAGLPQFEWVELYNRTSKGINLKDFQLSSGSSPKQLPEFILAPGAYVLVADDSNIAELAIYGDIIEVSSFPGLSNSGDVVTLKDQLGQIIHEVRYTTAWYKDDEKDNGGYTLELINPENPCLLEKNWTVSLHPQGGTPGIQNSVYNPTSVNSGPLVLSAVALSNTQIIIQFDRELGIDFNEMQFDLFPFIDIVDIEFGSSSDQILLTVAQSMEINRVYNLEIAASLEDCLGNIRSNAQEAKIVVPAPLGQGDIVINEILFNPIGDESDYVELYNKSDKYLNLSSLRIGNIKQDGSGTIKGVNQTILLPPRDLLVFTEDGTGISQRYPAAFPDKIFVVDLPSFNNSDGNVSIFGIIGNEELTLDSMNYDEDMHHPFIDNFDGIALERVDYKTSSTSRTNWQSASASTGYGTPTLPNSQAVFTTPSEAYNIDLASRMFSPNGDDMADELSINFEMDRSDYLATVDVFDKYGRFIRRIVSNQLLGRQDNIYWDGLNEENHICKAGVYVIFVRLVRSDGFVANKKLPCVLAIKL
ncbi:MAG: lamin tail domain-containing protein [Bacteroidia bacterium]|nr:lamin tail domain-containing protein [Bacteroidia bacterium]